MNITTDITTTEELATHYGSAWNQGDLDTIAALHAQDSEFELHLDGFARAIGREACIEQFELFFATWPRMHFATERLRVLDDLFVHQFRFKATMAHPMPVGGRFVGASGFTVDIRGVDVIAVRDLQVVAKETYLDSEHLLRQVTP